MDGNSSSSSARNRSHSYHGKVVIMILFLIMDLGLNSILDYDILNDQRPDNILLGVFGLQVVIQISIFLILFLATADTYLFRVGLLGVLVRTIQFVLLLHPLYMALTIAVGAYRVRRLSASDTLSTLWVDDTFITMSFIQKIVAIPYYIANVRATIKLEDPIYFNKQAWINLIKQQKSLFEKN
mmetsp:Transcript_22505/g.37603  ORF Transcript_22505/g.37603 Transcript_22505/m.37603 type:complete len:183 (-) Transcript_22505:609-1157(-)